MCRAEDLKTELSHRRLWIDSRFATYAFIAVLLTAVLLVARWIIANPYSRFDTTWAATIVHWNAPGLDTFLNTVAFLSDNWPALILGLVGMGYLFTTGSTRLAAVTGASGLIVAVIASVADFTLGVWVGRERPLYDAIGPSFPSGHAFGTTAFFGFAVYLAFRHRIAWHFRVPLVAVAVVLVGASGLFPDLPGRALADRRGWRLSAGRGHTTGVDTSFHLV